LSRSNLYRRIPGRVHEWWSFLVPFLLGIGYICAFYFNSQFPETLSISALFLVSIAMTAGFGYMLNDLTDLKEDLLSGKRNIVAHWGILKSFLMLIVFLVFAAAPWYFLPRSIVNLSVYGFQLFLLIIYSIPPLRLKKFAIPGIINDAFYNSVVPVFIMITTFFVLSKAIIWDYIFQLSIVFVWAILKGLRNILLHQLQDRKNDARSGLITFVVRYGPLTTTNILNRWILPLEIALITLLVVLISFFIPGFWIIYILFLLFILLKIRIWSIGWISRREFRRMFHFVLNDFYEDWMPLSVLIYLSVKDPWFLVLLALHLVLFPRTVIKYIREIKEINSDFIVYYRQPFGPQFCLWMKPFFAEINRFFKFISKQTGLFFKYIIKTPVRTKKSFIYINRHYFGGRFSLVRDMIITYIQTSRHKLLWLLSVKRINNHNFKPVNREFINGYNKQRVHGPRKRICMAPLTNLYFDNSGNIAACRFNCNYLIEDPGTMDISNVWTGEPIQKLRHHLERNDMSQGCDLCKDRMESKLFQAVGARRYDGLKSNSRHPVCMEFNFDDPQEIQSGLLDHFLPHLKTARFLGPEPFSNDLYFRIWKKMISVNRSCIIDVLTSGYVLNEKVLNILGKGLFRIRISINSLIPKHTNESDVETDPDRLLKNIRTYAEISSRENIPIHLVFIPDKDNWKSLPEIVELCNNIKAFTDINLAEASDDRALWNLPKVEIKNVYDYFMTHLPKGSGLISKMNKKSYISFVKGMVAWSIEGNPNGKQQFKKS